MIIKDYLKRKKMTRMAFSEELGIGIKNLYLFLNYSHLPSLKVAVKIEEVTNGRIKPKHLVADFEANGQSKPKAIPKQRGKATRRAASAKRK